MKALLSTLRNIWKIEDQVGVNAKKLDNIAKTMAKADEHEISEKRIESLEKNVQRIYTIESSVKRIDGLENNMKGISLELTVSGVDVFSGRS